MVLTKKEHQEVTKVYDTWLTSYLNGDVKTYDSFFDDRYHFIGSTANEHFLDRAETTKFLEATADQLAGKVVIRNNRRILEKFEGLIFVTEIFDSYFLIENEWTYYGKFRFTSALKKNKEGWRFIYQHFSTPDSKAEKGETIGTQKIAAENLMLREAVKRRTVELEQKNRELQIEAALERVRARAMSMRDSSELAFLVGLVFKELIKLDFSLTRCYIYIIDPEDLSLEAWTYNTEIGGIAAPFHIQNLDLPYYQAMIKAWKSKKKRLVYELAGKEKEETDRVLFSQTEYQHLPEKVRAGMASVDKVYLSYSFNHFGAIQTGGLEPFSDEKMDIFNRFGKVFDLTYTRFNDLKQAEAQALEAQIEAALERVRSKTMAMHNSADVGDTVVTMFGELVNLGIQSNRCGVVIFSESKFSEIWTAKSTSGDQGSLVIGYLDVSIHPLLENVRMAWERKDSFFSQKMEGEYLRGYYKTINSYKEYPTSFNMDQLPEKETLSDFYFSEGAIFAFTNEPLKTEATLILKRFAGVFGQTYRRYLDLQKAEEQAKEAKIEASLEKVRSRSLAMHKADELGEVATVVFDKLRELDMPVADGVAIVTHIEGSKDQIEWMESPGHPSAIKVYQPYYDHPILDDYWKAKDKGLDFISPRYNAEESRSFFNHIFEFTDYKYTPQEIKDHCLAAETYSYSAAFQKNSSIFINDFSGRSLSEQEIDIVKRFSKVFEQAYTRFLDLQKAEAQAREAQIEAGLERVRAQTMAMHNSEDVAKCIIRMFDELTTLGVDESTRFGIGILNHEDENNQLWTVRKDGEKVNMHIGNLDMTLHPLLKSARKAWKEQVPLHQYVLEGEDLINYYQMINNAPDYKLQIAIEKLPDREYHYGFVFNHGFFYAFCPREFQPDLIQITQRFSSVFAQTYQRYLDLQKAEEQAREAEIQLALERVRAKTMAIHESDELLDTVTLLFEQFKKVQSGNELEDIDRSFFLIYNEGNGFDLWITEQGGSKSGRKYLIEASEKTHGEPLMKGFQNKQPVVVVDLNPEKSAPWFDYLRAQGVQVSDELYKVRRINTNAYFSKGYLGITSYRPLSDENLQLLGRFSAVFEQTYTRFLDLQKAEAQAREAQIEAALERVRSRTMGMQHSNELQDAAMLLFQQVEALSVPVFGCGFNIWDDDRKAATAWMAGKDRLQPPFKTLSSEDIFLRIYKSAQKGESLFVEEQGGEALKTHYEYMNSIPVFKEIADKMAAVGQTFPTFQIMHCAFFSQGYLMFISFEPVPEAYDIFIRFAKVFEQTYTRFLDLKKAEQQAHEAVKQASLDRVRGEIASMRTANDLEYITPLIWKELIVLNVAFIRCGVFIMDEDQEIVHNYLSTPDGKAIAAFHLSYNTPGFVSKVLNHWKEKKIYIEHWNRKAMQDFAHVLVDQGIFSSPDQYLRTLPPKGFYLHLLPFQQGMLYVGNLSQLGKEELDLLQLLANAFSTAYARYDDFNKLELAKKQVDKALVELKQAQQQLIQSEKMASLGELTAGIAHEIQNPLNFVNNFSEVNRELIAELEEAIFHGDYEEVKAIAKDLAGNQEKINHHGKRAEGIVKGMLQHSRSSTGQKELTDINALCDEYFRLAYHGFRAKDKSFNAEYKLELDHSLPGISVVPQDIGRVLLNLINNAFFAVTEKKKSLNPEDLTDSKDHYYSPIVSISSKKLDDRVVIVVSDNGNGIPFEILDKIFQPFFTTKPTGQGTGLGLSLSYDIIKAHGGELVVESKEGEGTSFFIKIPLT